MVAEIGRRGHNPFPDGLVKSDPIPSFRETEGLAIIRASKLKGDLEVMAPAPVVAELNVLDPGARAFAGHGGDLRGGKIVINPSSLLE